MKKTIILVVISIVVGYILSKFMFSQYKTKEPSSLVSTTSTEYFFVQLGVYSTYESMINNTTKLDNYIYNNENDKYYVFTCITLSKDNLTKIENYYKNNGFSTFVKKFNISNSKLKEQIDKYDLLLNNVTDDTSIKVLCKEILDTYKVVK